MRRQYLQSEEERGKRKQDKIIIRRRIRRQGEYETVDGQNNQRAKMIYVSPPLPPQTQCCLHIIISGSETL